MSVVTREALQRGRARLSRDSIRPRVLKIGIDTGSTLVRFARQHPELFYVGVEIKKEKARVAVSRIRRNKCSNAIIVNMEAHEFISNYVEDECFHEIMIFFPTPFTD